MSIESRDAQQVGPYELLHKLGRGGMSTVYKARDTRTDAIVAVKLASRVVINDALLSRRFEQEYSLAKPLKHAHLVKVLDHGMHEGQPYLVMEYLDGPSLAGYLKTHGRIGEHEALAIVFKIADVLTYLHKKKILHRDIKPANILMTADGEVKLADLGLVKNLDSLSRLTRTRTGLGTMQFASPEQFDDAGAADARSDVYSLAGTLYQMLTEEFPFGTGSTLTVVERKLQNKLVPPRRKAPQIRACVDLAIRMALDADRDKRPASIEEFIAYLTGEKKPAGASEPPSKTQAHAKSGLAKKQKEQRRGQRFTVELPASCRAVVNVDGKRWPAWIVDVSSTGLCLNSQRRFEPGTLLEVSFTLQRDNSTITQLARVRWARAGENKAWLIGGEFGHALATETLNSICADQMDDTKLG